MPTHRAVFLSRIAALFLSTFIVVPSFVFAAENTPATQSLSSGTTYNLMAPLGNILTGSVSLTAYLQGAVKVLIGLAGVLAVLMIVICGIKMMGTPSASAKSEAKECVWNAIFGVLLAVGAWILLYQINPALLSSDMQVTILPPPPPPPAVNTTVPAGGTPLPDGCGGGASQPFPTLPGWYFKYCDATTQGTFQPGGLSAQACAQLVIAAEGSGKKIVLVNNEKCFRVSPPAPGTPPPAPGTPPPPSTTGDEAAVRTRLCGNASCVGTTPTSVNKPPCADPTSRSSCGCTSVAGLPQTSIDVIKALPGNIIVSGGTERCPHAYTPGSTANHGAGNNVFDLGKAPQLEALIKAPGNEKKKSFGNYWRWLYNGFWWTDEGNHWHACIVGASNPSMCQ